MSSSLNMSFSDSNSTIHSSSSSSGSSSSLSSLNSSSSSSSSSSSCSSIDMELAPFLAKSSNGNEAARKKLDDEILDMENSMNGYSSHTSRHLHHLVHGSSAANNILQNLLLYIRSQVPPYRYLLQFVFFGVPILLVCYFLFLLGFAAFDHGFFDPNVEDKIMVIYPSEELPFELTKAQGAFSDFVAVIGAILYGQFYGAAAIKVYYNNPLYVDADRGDNYFDYFYKTSLIPLKPHLDLTKCCEEIHFNNWIARFGKFGTFSRFVIGHNQRPHQDKFPFKPFRSRNDLSTVIQQYIHPQTFVEDKVNSLIQDEWLFSRKYEEERQNVIVVGVHYRGTDKKALYPYRSPSYAVFDYYIRQVFYLQSIDRQIKAATSSPASSSLSLSNFVLFVATDEVEFIEWVQKRFSSIHVSFLKDSPRLSKTPEPGVDVETTGTHKSKRFSGFQKGFTSLVDCLLLAKTDYIVKTRSSLSDVALMYNPKINFTILLGPNDKEYSTDNRLVGPEKISIWDDPNPTNAYDPVADAKLWKEKFRRR